MTTLFFQHRLTAWLQSLPSPYLGFALAAVACCLATSHASAQTISTLYESSNKSNAAYQAEKASYLAVVKRVEQAKAPLRPSLAIQGDAAVVHQDGTNPNFERSSTDLQLGLQGKLPLYNPKNKIIAEQAYKNAMVQLSDLRDKEQDLVLIVAKSYFDVLAAHEDLEVVKTQKKAINKQLEAAKLNFEVGTATITDSREAQASSDLIDAQMRALENQLLASYSSLQLRAGKDTVWVHPLHQPFTPPQMEERSLQEWLALAQEKSYVIQQAQRAIELAKLRIEEAKTGKKPTVDLYGSYGINHQSKSANAPSGSNRLNDARVGVRMNWALYDGKLTENKVAEALLLQNKAEAQLLEVQRQTSHSIRTAYNNVQASQARIAALKSALASSKSALEAINIGYEVGVRINIDVLNGQNLVSQTQRDLAKAQYGLLQSQLQLRRAAGVLKAKDLQQIDALLNTNKTLHH